MLCQLFSQGKLWHVWVITSSVYVCVITYPFSKFDVGAANIYNNLFIYQVLCTLIHRRRSLYSSLSVS